MIGGNMPFERELIEQRSLFDLPMSHHDSVLSHRLNQRPSPRATKEFFNEIDPQQTSLRRNKQTPPHSMTSSADGVSAQLWSWSVSSPREGAPMVAQHSSESKRPPTWAASS